MHAIRAAHAFDGTQFLAGGATVLVDGDRIAAIQTGWVELPHDVDVTEYEGTVLPGLFDCHTHLVADATFGGLERVGTMTDEAIDAVMVEPLRPPPAARGQGERSGKSGGRRAPGGWSGPATRPRPSRSCRRRGCRYRRRNSRGGS